MKKVVRQLSASARLAQELINREVKLPKELSRVSIVYHTQSHSNKPYRNLVKYRYDSLSGANPHVFFNKIVYNDHIPSNNNFITLEMIDGTEKKLSLDRKEVDADKITQLIMKSSQELVPSVDKNLAKYLREYEERIQASKIAARE